MNKFIGVKILQSATLMTRGEYVAKMGWELPANQNASEEVYMVEYEPTEDNVPNLAGYAGYVTMSPKAVFDKAYTAFNNMSMGTLITVPLIPYQVRVVEELTALGVKITDLENYTSTGLFEDLGSGEKGRLQMQLNFMKGYFSVLVERIKNF